MKTYKFLSIIGLTLLSASCDGLFEDVKPKKKHVACQVLASESVPASVKDSVNLKFPSSVIEKWFNKDNKSYVAQMTLNAKSTLVFMDHQGNYQKTQETGDNNQQGQHEDKDSEDGCECETEND